MFNASRAPMHHIDRKELYTSLEKRLEYLQSFLDFGPDDMAALESGSKYLRTFIPALVNIIYRKLLQYDITARAFSTRSTSYEGPIKQQLDEEAPQILHRKVFLRGYLNALCKDPGSKAFWEYADKVGMMHTGLGRSAPLHIEYVHISATLGLIQDVLNEAILSHPKLAIGRKIAITKALGKVIWIQNDLFAKWYVRDGEEFSDDAVLPEKEKEGFIGGRKIVGEGEIEGEVDRMELEEARSACPFARFAQAELPVRRKHVAPDGEEEDVVSAASPALAAQEESCVGDGDKTPHDRPSTPSEPVASPIPSSMTSLKEKFESMIPVPVGAEK